MLKKGNFLPGYAPHHREEPHRNIYPARWLSCFKDIVLSDSSYASLVIVKLKVCLTQYGRDVIEPHHFINPLPPQIGRLSMSCIHRFCTLALTDQRAALRSPT